MNKTTLIFGGAILFLLFILFTLILITPFVQKKPDKIISPTTTPTKTIVQPSYIPPTLEPTLVHPTSTGAKEDISYKEMTQALQIQNLKKKLPFQTDEFKIEFDYSSDKFNVTLAENNEANKSSFEKWVKINYSLIPLTKFAIATSSSY